MDLGINGPSTWAAYFKMLGWGSLPITRALACVDLLQADVGALFCANSVGMPPAVWLRLEPVGRVYGFKMPSPFEICPARASERFNVLGSWHGKVFV